VPTHRSIHRVRLSSTARIKAGSAAPSMLSNARPGNSIVTLPADGSPGTGVGVSAGFGASGSDAIVTGTRAVSGFDLRTCNSPRSYCHFQRNTWLAFTPFASPIPATLAPGSSVSFTILSFSSTRRKIRRFRPDCAVPSMRPIISRRITFCPDGKTRRSRGSSARVTTSAWMAGNSTSAFLRPTQRLQHRHHGNARPNISQYSRPNRGIST
jgi:hypothetical protein